MAGIGFRLQKLFTNDYFTTNIMAYGYAGIITAGPWITTVSIVLFAQVYLLALGVDKEAMRLFNVGVFQSFAFTQILFGFQQLPLTRYLSDLIYSKNDKRILSALIGFIKVTVGTSVIVWLFFLTFSNLTIELNLLFLFLFFITHLIWGLNVFLSAAKDYHAIVKSYLFGAIIAVTLIYVMTKLPFLQQTDTQTLAFFLLLAFTIGMACTVFGLLYTTLKFCAHGDGIHQFEYVIYMRRYPKLVFIGGFLTLGIWIGNMLIWFGEGSEVIAGTFRYNHDYDLAMFLSQLTIIPSFVMFLVFAETDFALKFHRFQSKINGEATLQQIHNARSRLERSYFRGIGNIIKVQSIVTLIIALFAPYFFLSFGMEFIYMIRLTLIGASMLAIIQLIILFLLYVEDQTNALIIATVYFLLHTVLVAVLLPYGYDAYGLGFAVAGTVTFIVALWRSWNSIAGLDFRIISTDWTYDSNSTIVGRFINRLHGRLQKRYAQKGE